MDLLIVVIYLDSEEYSDLWDEPLILTKQLLTYGFGTTVSTIKLLVLVILFSISLFFMARFVSGSGMRIYGPHRFWLLIKREGGHRGATAHLMRALQYYHLQSTHLHKH